MIALVVVLGVIYLGLCTLLFVKQRAFIYPAPTERAPVHGTKQVRVPGATFYEWKRVEGNGPVVVHLHGNGEQVAYLSWLASQWADRGVSFVAIEYPGYPDAGGSPSEAELVRTAEAALEHLVKELQVDRSRLVLVGQSLGTGVAVQLAARGWGTRMVLLTPYTSLTDVAASAFSIFPVRLLMLDRFDSLALAPKLKVPTFVVHGTDDEVIPFALGEQLAASISGARFMKVPGAHHNDLWDRPEVVEAIEKFVLE
jgi:uncharacterized protein